MRRVRVLCLGLLALSLAGCLNDRPVRSSSLIDRVRGMGGPSGPDAVYIEYTVVERPAGNAAMNRLVWSNVDELVVPSEARALLSENGIRAGVVGGLLPSELEAMLQNPSSALGSRHRRLFVNNAAPITISGPVPQAEFLLRPTAEAKESSVRFDNAKFILNLTPRHGEPGRVLLTCTPEIEHHDKKRWMPLGAVGDAWASQKPVERFASLAFEVNLSPREFLVIGADYSRNGWFGNQIFSDTVKGGERVQRLLIVRVGHVTAPETRTAFLPPAGVVTDESTSVHSQPEVSATRGIRP